MFIVETVSTPRYISGIFTQEADAQKSLQSPGKPRVLRKNNLCFPFYVIEEGRSSGNQFRYVNQTQLLRVLRNIVRTDDDEKTYLNVYYIYREFRVRGPADEMGSLVHCHVNNEWLEKFDEFGTSLIVEMI